MTREEIQKASPAQINEWIDEYIMTEKVVYAGDYPRWSTEISAAWKVERKILALSKWEKYIEEIEKMVIHHPEASKRKFFMVHASPTDRCKAAILAVMDL